MPLNKDDETPRPGRSEIEQLCIVYAVGDEGTGISDLAGKLGVSHSLETAVVWAIALLVSEGLLAERGGHVTRTEQGGAVLQTALARYAVVGRLTDGAEAEALGATLVAALQEGVR